MIQVKMNKKTLENVCLELVTINGRPFKPIDDSGFRKILNSLLENMQAKFNINAKNIREKIGEKANDVRYRIKLEVEGKLVPLKFKTNKTKTKLVSLKADVAPCRDRPILGVSLQFMSDGKIQLSTLAIKELKENHSGFYSKTVLMKSLNNMELKAIKFIALQQTTVPTCYNMYASFLKRMQPKELLMFSSPVVEAGRVTQKNSLVMKMTAVLLMAKTLKFSSATSILRTPAQRKQEISGTMLVVLLTPYSWQ